MDPNFYIILLEIIIALIGAYLIYYARQKGKNQADKEDFAAITKTVEEVKQNYTEENELLRANLNVLTSRQNLMFSEEKESIIQFYGRLNKWIWEGLRLNVNEYTHNNYQELNDKLVSMRDDYHQTNIALGKLQLIIKDDDLGKLSNEILLETLKVHNYIESLIKRLQNTLSWEKIYIDQITSEGFDFDKISTELKAFYTLEAKKRDEEKKKIFDEHIEKNKTLFTEVFKLKGQFQSLGRDYLNK